MTDAIEQLTNQTQITSDMSGLMAATDGSNQTNVTRENSFASFAELKAKFDELNVKAYEESKAWIYSFVGGFRKQIVPILREVRDVLSQRGQFHDLNNDLPGWTE